MYVQKRLFLESKDREECSWVWEGVKKLRRYFTVTEWQILNRLGEVRAGGISESDLKTALSCVLDAKGRLRARRVCGGLTRKKKGEYIQYVRDIHALFEEWLEKLEN